MIRRDANQDGDRPHFYSQYWIDVALGKPTGSSATAAVATEPEEDFDLDDEALAPPLPAVRPEPVAKPAKPAKAPEKKAEPAKISSFADLANIDLLMKNSAQLDDDVAPDLAGGYEIPADAPAFPLDEPVEADEEVEPAIESLEEAEALEYDDDEDEEDDEWGNRRPGKKTKPTPPRRERRRDF
jgi:hypothetical protein